MDDAGPPIINTPLFWSRKSIVSVGIQIRADTPISKILKTFPLKDHFSTLCIAFIPIWQHPVTINWVIMQSPNSGRNYDKRSTAVEEFFRIIKYTDWVESMLQHVEHKNGLKFDSRSKKCFDVVALEINDIINTR